MKTCPPLFRSNLHLKSGWVNIYPPRFGDDDEYRPGVAHQSRELADGKSMVSYFPTELVPPLYRVKVTLHAR